MQKFLPLFIGFFFFSLTADAQFSRYIIKFKDKGSNPYSLNNPLQYLTQRALDRRARYNIGLDSTDLPVTPRYVDSLRAAGAVTVMNTSKWLNQVLIKTSDPVALAKINSFPFVLSSSPIAPLTSVSQVLPNKFGTSDPSSGFVSPPAPENLVDYYNYGRSNGQVKIHRGDFLHNLGFRGQGMHLAMLDAGFSNYLTLPVFDSIRMNNQVLGTYDFVLNEASVNEDHNHGTQCLSTIAANIPGVFVGTAPKTSFYLYRTEDVFSEYPVEEQNWAAGVERADSLGVDVTSTSLGYYHFDNPIFNYSYSDMNGNTTISARAGDIAAKKGMLMVVADGNEGNSSWHYIITPSDADSVMSVGAVDTLGNVPGFSSYGPSSDGQVKPEVASVGWNAVISNTSTGFPVYGNGTSFACPNLAGIATCLWQAFPEVNNIKIIAALKASATKATTPDDRVGYGIPNAKKAFVSLIKELYSDQSSFSGCFANLAFKVKTDSTMNVVIERKLSGEMNYSNVSIIAGYGAFSLKNINFTEFHSTLSGTSVDYRIRMNISTDTTFYLDTLSFIIRPCDPVLIAPNPVTDNLTIWISTVTDEQYTVVIHNAAGQKVYSIVRQVAPGANNIIIPMRKFSPGMYYATLFINNRKTVTKEFLKR